MTANELMQGLMALSCGITAAAVAFQIGRVWERKRADEVCAWAEIKRQEAAEKISVAEEEIAAIEAEREAMRQCVIQYNQLMGCAANEHSIAQRPGSRAGREIRNATHGYSGVSRPH